MASCEMCGVEISTPKKINVAGTQMSVCSSCSSKGNLVESEGPQSRIFYKRAKVEDVFDVVSNYISIINRELAKKNLTVHQLARIINIKESSLNKYMSGKISLDVTTARKIESYFKIQLVVKVEGKSDAEILDEMQRNEEEEKPQNLADMILAKIKSSQQSKIIVNKEKNKT